MAPLPSLVHLHHQQWPWRLGDESQLVVSKLVQVGSLILQPSLDCYSQMLCYVYSRTLPTTYFDSREDDSNTILNVDGLVLANSPGSYCTVHYCGIPPLRR